MRAGRAWPAGARAGRGGAAAHRHLGGAAGRAHAGQPPGVAPGGAAGQRHRLDPHGPRGRHCLRRALQAQHPGAGRQQCRHRRTLGRHRAGGARHHLCRGRHGGPALHHAASLLYPRRPDGHHGEPADHGVRPPARRRPARRRHPGRPADRHRRGRCHGQCAGRLPRAGQYRHRRRTAAGRPLPACLLRAARAGDDRRPARHHADRNLCPDPVPDAVHHAG